MNFLHSAKNCDEYKNFISFLLSFTAKNKKRKRKSKKNKKDKNSTESQANNTPRPKGDIPLEDASTAEYKAKEFLKAWNKDKTNWKFVKTRQNWLVHHLYNPEKVRLVISLKLQLF